MPKPGFAKISSSDTPLYGPRALLLCGFSAQAQSKFKALLNMLGISDLAFIWAAKEQSTEQVGDLMQRPSDFNAGRSSSLPRAVIVGGIMEKELHQLMAGCRKAGMKHALWATLTSTSADWSLERLLLELQAERKIMTSKRPKARR